MKREKSPKAMKFVDFFTLSTNIWSQLQKHRISARTKLQIQPLKSTTFLSLLPFILGFWCFVRQKYPVKKTNLFFEKNLPGISVPTEKLQWETFQYLLKNNNSAPLLQNFPGDTTFYWSDRNLTIQQENLMTKDDIFDKHLVTLIRKPLDRKKINTTLNTKNYTFSSQQPNHSNFLQFEGDLDEIPAKLQSAYIETNLQWNNLPLNLKSRSKLQQSPSGQKWPHFLKFSLENFRNDEEWPFFTNKRNNFQLRILAPISNNFNFLVALKAPPETNIFLGKNVRDFTNSKKPDSYKKQEEFLTNSNLFEQEIRKLFFNTGLIPVFPHSNIASPTKIGPLFKDISSKNEELKLIKDLLLDIDEISIPTEYVGARLMSGYRYPDMLADEVQEFNFHRNFFPSKKIQITLPASYSLVSPLSIPSFQLPEFLIQSKNLTLKNTSDNIIRYQGPGILLDPKNGLDWLVDISRKTNINLRFWVEKYLRTENPLSDSFENFFGVFESPDILDDGISSKEIKLQSVIHSSDQKDLKDYWTQNLPLFRDGILTNTTSSIFHFDRSFQLPVVSYKNNNTSEQKGGQGNPLEKLEKTTSYYESVAAEAVSSNTQKELPILETRLAKNRSPDFLFGIQTSLDYKFSSPLGFCHSNKDPFFSNSAILANVIHPSDQKAMGHNAFLTSGFLPQVSSFLAKENFENKYSSGVYKKLTSLFAEKPTSVFYDLWEPLTFRSWLVISQVGFAFLVFRILKALADNYGRELLVYLLDLVALLGFLDEDLKQEIEILMGQREKGFRIILKTKKNFTNIAGIQNLLPEVVEIVWFLRNSGREFSLSKTLPRGVLLTGPPGTGKTLLVQALAGEAEVPVLALSGSSLLEPGESGALKLEILFQEARRLAPCIVFIDEMDTLAQKRDQVLQNPMGADEVLESFHDDTSSRASLNVEINKANSDSNDPTETMMAQQDMQREKLRILMQFLVELDGIQGRAGVVVIGATNHPEMLDPAIVRPGRFDRVLELGLPGPEKRQDILKLYSQNLGVTPNISWNYLTHRTAGYSAADLASIMNQSSLRAILINSCHTVETIEHGIDRITTSGIEYQQSKTSKNRGSTVLSSSNKAQPVVSTMNSSARVLERSRNTSSQFATLRVAYYQAGKILLSTLLEHHPPTLVTHLWPRRTNLRAMQIASNLQKYFFRFARRIELEHRIIGCYAGKAAEILLLQSATFESNLSDLGTEDIQFAQNLIDCMIQKWYLYSKTVPSKKISSILTTKNLNEYRDVPEKIPFFERFLGNIESSTSQETLDVQSSSKQIEINLDQQSQSYFPVAWWQYQVSDEFEVSTRHFSDWYRLYLPDPQESERNLEWSPPDEFYHGNSLLENLTEAANWNDISGISIEYQKHSLILQSFNKALVLLDQHREILDKLAYELIQREILREPEIQEIFSKFQVNASINNLDSLVKEIPFPEESTSFFQNELNKNLDKPEKIVSPNWGINSRKKTSHWIDLNFES